MYKQTIIIDDSERGWLYGYTTVKDKQIIFVLVCFVRFGLVYLARDWERYEDKKDLLRFINAYSKYELPCKGASDIDKAIKLSITDGTFAVLMDFPKRTEDIVKPFLDRL